MNSYLILFADNDSGFLNARKRFLENAGYTILAVLTEDDARKELKENCDIALAILDIRLNDDEDEKDISGIEIAREEAHQLPKIILTDHSSFDNLRAALKTMSDGLPPAVEFVEKKEGPQALLDAIRYALGPGTAWMRSLTRKINQNDKILEDDYLKTRTQSMIFFITSLIAALIGIGILFYGIILAFVQDQQGLTLGQQITIGLLTTASSVIMEAISVLFFRRADASNQRMDRYHQERLQGRRFDILLDTCNAIPSPKDRDACRIQIVQTASTAWLIQPEKENKEE